VLFEKAKMDVVGVLLNSYEKTMPLKDILRSFFRISFQKYFNCD